MRSGIIYCFAGPSGSGKTTLSEIFRKNLEGVVSRIVTVTTRAPRDGEVDGIDYHFWTSDEFINAVTKDLFFEHEVVHGNYYGTLKTSLQDVISSSRSSVIILDVKGAIKLKETFPNDVVNVFMTCTHIAELRRRIETRNTTQEDIKMRLAAASKELDTYSSNVQKFDYLIVNDNLETSWTILANITFHERVKRGDVLSFKDCTPKGQYSSS
jgi:guanylate kinase